VLARIDVSISLENIRYEKFVVLLDARSAIAAGARKPPRCTENRATLGVVCSVYYASTWSVGHQSR